MRLPPAWYFSILFSICSTDGETNPGKVSCAVNIVFHKPGLEAGVSPKDELKWGARDLTGPGLETSGIEELKPCSSHLDFLFGVVEGVREENDEEDVSPGVEDTVLLVPDKSVTLAMLEAGADVGGAAGEGEGREEETT